MSNSERQQLFDYYLRCIPQIGEMISQLPAGQKFIIPTEHVAVYRQLLGWFLRMPDCGLQLHKGILLEGPPGTGKTTMMKIFQRMTGGLFIITPTRDIVREYISSQDKNSYYAKWTRESFAQFIVSGHGHIGRWPRQVCFDDLGLEAAESKSYGNSISVMKEILLDRYDLFKQTGMITHGTTNLTPTEIETMYGDRVRDRSREMFNLVKVLGTSLRK